MYWSITLLVSLGGLAACWGILSSRWRIVSGADDPVLRGFNPQSIRITRTFHPILPGDSGYLDLKLSALRHALAFFVSAGLLWLLDSRFWETVLLWLNLLYAVLTCWRYSARKKELQEIALESSERSQLVIPTRLVRDSFVVVAYSVIAVASLYLLLYLDVPVAPAEPVIPQDTSRQTVETTAPKLVARPRPANGKVFENFTSEGCAPLEISASESGDVYVVVDPISLQGFKGSIESNYEQLKLDEKYMELRFYVRAGSSAEFTIPLGTYDIYYATGDTWYGEEDLFGPETRYYKCDRIFGFSEDSDGYNGYTIELTAVYNGNLDTDLVDESDFPK